MERTAASRISRGTVRAFLLVPSLHPMLHDHERDWNGAYSAPGGLPLKVLKAKMTTVRVDTLN